MKTTDRIMTVLVATIMLGGLAMLVGIAWSITPPVNGWWFPWAVSALAAAVGTAVMVFAVDAWKRPL